MHTLTASLRSALCLLCLLGAEQALHADQRADDLLREVEKSTRAVASLGADLQVTLTTQNLAGRPQDPRQSKQGDTGFGQGNEPISFTYIGTVKLKRSNLERIELADPIHETIASDGTFLWTLLPTNEYIKMPADPQGKNLGAYPPILMFFAPETARTAGIIPAEPGKSSDNFATRYLGKERVVFKSARAKQDQGGTTAGTGNISEEFDVVEVRQLRPTVQALKLYISADKMVTRVVSETRRGGILTIQDVSLINLKPGQKFSASEFVFELPSNARPYVLKPATPRQ